MSEPEALSTNEMACIVSGLAVDIMDSVSPVRNDVHEIWRACEPLHGEIQNHAADALNGLIALEASLCKLNERTKVTALEDHLNRS